MSEKVRLDTFDTGDFDKGAGKAKQALWFFVNALLVKASWNPFMGIKIALLRAFGAKIGRGTVIKNNVCVKFPWKLEVGDNVWLGENAWIDNLDKVAIGSNVCISQGALLLTGNHDYTISSFDYRNAPIVVEDGAWIGAKALVCPGVVVGTHAVLAAGGVATKSLRPWTVYQGNPAKEIRERKIRKR